MWDWLINLFGPSSDGPVWWQMGLRAVAIYVSALALVRIAERRLLGRRAAIDVIIGIMLGTLLGSAITGNADVGSVLLAAMVLVVLHFFMATLAYHFEPVDRLIKGNKQLLVEDGQLKRDQLRRTHVTLDELEGALRSNTSMGDMAQVEKAYQEQGGSISFVRKKGEPKVIEVSVNEGVQVIRIELVG